MKPDGRGVTVVGDDAQSIYSFRAATVRNILDFPATIHAAGARGHARAQLPLDAADPRRLECGDRAGAPSASPRTCGPTGRIGEAAARHRRATKRDQARYVADRVLD